jgi:hypothetical protein
MNDARTVLGWQFALPHPDPGPRPARPSPPEQPRLDPGWVAAQRREEDLLNRPLKITAGLAGALGLAVLLAAITGAVNVIIAGLMIAICVIAGGTSSAGVWQGERALRARVAAERVRVGRFRAYSDDQLAAALAEHERRARDWQARRFAFETQKRWYAVALPSGIERVDLAGGTLPGWSAVATTLAAYRLAAGGQVTILDVSGGSVGSDLLAVARSMGISPLVWVLPDDLPRLDLTSGLDATALADVLAATASGDASIVERILGVVSAGRVDRVLAGLRALAGVGDPLADVEAGILTADEVVRLTRLYGHESAARERSWDLVARLEPLASAGTAVPRLPHSPLRVLAVSNAVGGTRVPVLGAFAATALAHLLREAPPGGASWRHTLMVFGAERLPPEVLDRVSDACAMSGTGLLLAFRTVPPEVRSRLGRGNAAVAFMRLGNAEDAKAASEQLGSEHRFVLSQLTETAGASVTDTTGASYTSTVSASGSLSKSVTVSESAGSGRGGSAAAGPLPTGGTRSRERSQSRGESAGESVTEGIGASSAWGRSVSTAASSSGSVAQAAQRTRELLVEPHELQQLPPTALILSYASAAGRSVVLADVNPGIGALPSATLTPLGEAALLTPSPAPRSPASPGPGAPGPASGGPGSRNPGAAGPGAAGPGSPGPGSPAGQPRSASRPAPTDLGATSNLGPPPARLDWRRR